MKLKTFKAFKRKDEKDFKNYIICSISHFQLMNEFIKNNFVKKHFMIKIHDTKKCFCNHFLFQNIFSFDLQEITISQKYPKLYKKVKVQYLFVLNKNIVDYRHKERQKQKSAIKPVYLFMIHFEVMRFIRKKKRIRKKAI